MSKVVKGKEAWNCYESVLESQLVHQDKNISHYEEQYLIDGISYCFSWPLNAFGVNVADIVLEIE